MCLIRSGNRSNNSLADDSRLALVIHGSILICPVNSKDRVPCRECRKDIIFYHFKALRIAKSILQCLCHKVQRSNIFSTVQSRIVILINKGTAKGACNAGIIADKAFCLSIAADNRIFANSLFFAGFRICNELIPSCGGCFNSGLF